MQQRGASQHALPPHAFSLWLSSHQSAPHFLNRGHVMLNGRVLCECFLIPPIPTASQSDYLVYRAHFHEPAKKEPGVLYMDNTCNKTRWFHFHTIRGKRAHNLSICAFSHVYTKKMCRIKINIGITLNTHPLQHSCVFLVFFFVYQTMNIAFETIQTLCGAWLAARGRRRRVLKS